MNIIDKKPEEETPNVFYGVDINDKEAVTKEFKRRKRNKIVSNIVTIVVIAILGFLVFDFVRVNMLNKDPILYWTESVEGGTVYKGIGFSKIYCDNGDIYDYTNKKNKCTGSITTFKDLLQRELKAYLVENKIITDNKIKTFQIVSFERDEDFDPEKEYNEQRQKEFEKEREEKLEEDPYAIVDDEPPEDQIKQDFKSLKSVDYIVNIEYTCKNNSNCFKTLKTQKEKGKYQLFVSVNGYNKVVGVTTYKTTGNHYEELVTTYKEQIKQILMERNILNLENLKDFNISLDSNLGLKTYKGVQYADSYIATISYMCLDDSNTCVNREGFSYDVGLSFKVGILVDDEGTVKEMVNEAILNV